MSKRKNKAKVDDVYLEIDDNGVIGNPSNHPTKVSSQAKDNINRQNEKAKEDVKSSIPKETVIDTTIPDYNTIGDSDSNDEGIFIKKENIYTGDRTNSTYQEYIKEQEKIDKNIDLEIESLENDTEIEQSDILEQNQYYIKSEKTYNSSYGPYIDNLELSGDINKSKFSNKKGDINVEVYNGEGELLGYRPLVRNNPYRIPIIQDFYAAVARLSTGAELEGVDLTFFRGYQSINNQTSIRRQYAPENKKTDDEWLKSAESNAGFKNFNGDDIKVNKPGYGYHIFGTAFDIDTINNEAYKWMIKNAHNYGFYRTIESEIWHWEYKPWLYRLGGEQNPSQNKSDAWTTWKNLYKQISNENDPIGPKFIPKNHTSWLGYEDLAEIKLIDNSIPPFISSGNTGETIIFADLVEQTPQNVKPPSSIAKFSGEVPKDKDEFIASVKEIFKNKGYTWYDGILELNIIGVRTSKGGIVNKFDDNIYVVWKDKNNIQQLKIYEATTEPGLAVLQDVNWIQNYGGAAILVPNQYKAHKLGFHHKSYMALVQTAGKVEVFRDNNLDNKYDYNSDAKKSGSFGINIHRSNANRPSTLVEKWSAGCQVFSNPSQWKEFINIVKESAIKQGESKSKINQAEKLANKGTKDPSLASTNFGEFTYTLLEENDFS